MSGGDWKAAMKRVAAASPGGNFNKRGATVALYACVQKQHAHPAKKS